MRGDVLAPFHASEPDASFEHSRPDPAEHHHAAAPALHVADDVTNPAQQALDSIGGPQRALESIGHPEFEDRERLLEPFA